MLTPSKTPAEAMPHRTPQPLHPSSRASMCPAVPRSVRLVTLWSVRLVTRRNAGENAWNRENQSEQNKRQEVEHTVSGAATSLQAALMWSVSEVCEKTLARPTLGHFSTAIATASRERKARKEEKATRQWGSLLARENSSNGGKAIGTFWRQNMVGPSHCQAISRPALMTPLSTLTSVDRHFGRHEPSPFLCC